MSKKRIVKKPLIKIERDGKFYTKRGVELTRASNTKTEAGFKSWLLGGLRGLTRYWKPAQDAWKLNLRLNQSGSRHKYEHLCAVCKQWFVKKKVLGKKRNTIELDHITPIGGLDSLSKLEEWVSKAFIEIDGYQKLCYTCHSSKSLEERRK